MLISPSLFGIDVCNTLPHPLVNSCVGLQHLCPLPNSLTRWRLDTPETRSITSNRNGPIKKQRTPPVETTVQYIYLYNKEHRLFKTKVRNGAAQVYGMLTYPVKTPFIYYLLIPSDSLAHRWQMDSFTKLTNGAPRNICGNKAPLVPRQKKDMASLHKSCPFL